jgi:hypothetical protein
VDEDSTFTPCLPTYLIHTSCSLKYPNYKDITWSPSWHFLSWTVHKITWSLWSLSSELFHLSCQRILGSVFFQIFGKLFPTAEPQDGCNQAAGCTSLGKGWGHPLSSQNVKSWVNSQIVVIKDPPVPKTNTWEKEKILTKQFLFIKRVQAHIHSEQTCEHKMSDSGSSLHLPDAVVPTPYVRFLKVKGSQTLSIG